MVSMNRSFMSKSCGFSIMVIFASLKYCKASSCTLSFYLSFTGSEFSVSDSSSSMLLFEISVTNSLYGIDMSLWLILLSSLTSTSMLSTEASDGSESLWAWFSGGFKVYLWTTCCPLFTSSWDFTELSSDYSPCIRLMLCWNCMLFTF